MPITLATAAASTRSSRDAHYASVIVVLPVLHEHAEDLVSIVLEQPGCDRRVDAPRMAENDAMFRTHGRAGIAGDTRRRLLNRRWCRAMIDVEGPCRLSPPLWQ